MTKEKLQLNRKYLVIESPIPFEIYCPEQDDGVKRRQGSWQMTIHDLLTRSHYPLNPIYNLELIYDETLLGENDKIVWYTTDLNLGEALRGIDGQLVVWDYNAKLNVTNLYDSLNGNGIKEYIIYSNSFFKLFREFYLSKFGNIPRESVDFLVNKFNCSITLGGNAGSPLVYLFKDKVFYLSGGQYSNDVVVGEILAIKISIQLRDDETFLYRLFVTYVVDGVKKTISYDFNDNTAVNQINGYLTGFLLN